MGAFVSFAKKLLILDKIKIDQIDEEYKSNWYVV